MFRSLRWKDKDEVSKKKVGKSESPFLQRRTRYGYPDKKTKNLSHDEKYITKSDVYCVR